MTENKSPVILKYIAFFMLTASMVLVILGVYFYQKEDKFLNECKLITCKITSIEEKRLGKPVLTFTEVNGNYKPFTLVIEYDPSDEELGYNENEIVEVYLYEKDIPKSEIKGFFNNHLTSFILLIVGFALMMDFPILLMVSAKTRKQQLAKQQYGIKDEVITG